MSGTLDPLSPSVVATCALLAMFVATTVIVVMSRRDATHALEGFAAYPESWPSPEDLNNSRGDALARQGLSQFYTSGLVSGHSSDPDRPMFVSPTAGDVVQILGKVDKRPERKHADSVDNVSCSDSAFMGPRGTCGMAANGGGHQTCDVRVFDASYALTTACLKLSIKSALPRTSSDRTGVVLSLVADAPATSLFVLLRPAFLNMAGSSIYQVSQQPSTSARWSARSTTNSMTDFDSYRHEPMVAFISRVTDPLVSPVFDDSIDRDISQAVKGYDPKDVPVNVYFLRLATPLPIRSSDPNSGRVLTMFFKMPHVFPPTATLISTKAISILATRDGDTEATLDIHMRDPDKKAGASFTARVFIDALVVVTFSDDTLNIASMGKGRVTYVRYALERSFRAGHRGRIDVKRSAPPPAGLYPYDNTTIPDLADIAVRLRCFPAMAFK